jgi:hypothetical protein
MAAEIQKLEPQRTPGTAAEDAEDEKLRPHETFVG